MRYLHPCRAPSGSQSAEIRGAGAGDPAR